MGRPSAGDSSIYLARHGWRVTGVDFVARAVDKASAKADKVAVGSNFGLIVDNGCLHGMSAEDRDAYVREVTAVAADWTLLPAGDEPAWDRNGKNPARHYLFARAS
jgi:hypothetical protein